MRKLKSIFLFTLVGLIVMPFIVNAKMGTGKVTAKSKDIDISILVV